MKGSLVITKGKKCCSLYKSELKLVQGEANALSSNAITNLCHHRLGHMSKKGLGELKKNLFPNLKDSLIILVSIVLWVNNIELHLQAQLQGNLEFLSW